MSTYLLIEFAAVTQLAEGQILYVTEEEEEEEDDDGDDDDDDDDNNNNNNNNLYWDSYIITDKTVDFNKPDIVLIDRENKTALVIDIADSFTHTLPQTELGNHEI